MSTNNQQENQLSAPELPAVTRLNRNVLLVAGMGVGVVILAVTHVVRTDARVPEAPDAPPVEAGAMASFLEQPLAESGTNVVPPSAYPELSQGAYAADGPAGAVMIPTDASYGAMPGYDMYAEPVAAAPPRLKPEEEAYRRALRAGLRANGERSAASPISEHAVKGDGAELDPFAALEYAVPTSPTARAGYGLGPSTGAAAGMTPAARPRDRYREFLAAAAEDQPPTYVASRVLDPISPYQIMAGTLLPAMLVTGINSDLPGDILAQVTRNIYDSQQRHLLIPRGTKVIGRYDSQIALGQSRMLIAWTRLIFPDGRSLSLPGLPAKDLRGAAGLRDKVNNHYGRVYGQAILLSIVGAGAQLSQPQQTSMLTPASPGQVAAGALGQELSAVSMETIRRNMDVRPTLQVRPGTPFYIFLERDLVLEGVYAESR